MKTYKLEDCLSKEERANWDMQRELDLKMRKYYSIVGRIGKEKESEKLALEIWGKGSW